MSTPQFDLPPPVSTVSHLETRPTLFLSASVPEPRPPAEFEPSDQQAAREINANYVDHALPDRIRAAVVALTRVTLQRPRMRLAFGAHPSISPMVLQVARDMNAQPGSILVFQSWAYRNIIPGSTLAFADWSCGQLILTHEQPEAPFTQTLTLTGKALRRLSPYTNSLRFMRELMVSVPGTCGAAFIGGMNGVEDEAEIFARLQPGQPRFTLPSTGSAAARLLRSNPQGFNAKLSNPSAFLGTPSYSVAASMILDELVP